ncbi:MAG: heparinase II/III family protein [Armatimonadota bacterium]
MRNFDVIMAWCAVILLAPTALASFPQNLLSGKLGTKVFTNARLADNSRLEDILSDGIISKGQFRFDKIDQQQVFTVDFGCEREFDRVEFGSAGWGEEGGAKVLRIGVSRTWPDGPFEQVYERQKVGYFQVCRLPLTRARWVRFDLGRGTEGALVHSVRIYKGYRHPDLVEVTKLLADRIAPDVPGLEGFYSAVKARNWTTAAAKLRAYYARTHPPKDPPDPNADLRAAEQYASGDLDFAGIKRRETVPIDWSYQETRDWYEHKNFLNRGRMIGYPLSAYYNTGEKKWLDRFRACFYDWVDANPCPPETIYADHPTWRTLDTAMRLGWLYEGFPRATASGIDDELWANYLYLIWQHADYLHRDKISGGNWLATITMHVMETAVRFPEFADRKRWMEFARSGFETNVLRDIYPDGKEKEDAPGYVCMAYIGMFETLKGLDEVGIKVRDDVRERMNKVQTFLGAITQPDGIMPAIGDSSFAGPDCLNDTWAYFGRDDIRYILSRGRDGKPPAWGSINFPDGGWSVMRSPYDKQPYEEARHLVFKSSSESHGHLDVLSFTLYAYGRQLLIDPSIKSYEREDGARYVQTAYHNTITVDGQNQRKGGGSTDRWASNSGFDYITAHHDRYEGLIHRRSIIFVKSDYWLVRDEITGSGSHTFDQNWHFLEDAGLSEDRSTMSVRTGYPDGNLLMIPLDREGLTSQRVPFKIAKARMAGGSRAEVDSFGWRYSKRGPTPVVFDILLYPYKGAEVPRVESRKYHLEGATAYKISAGERTDYVLLSHEGVREMKLPEAHIAAIGEVIVLRMAGGKLVRVSGANVQSVEIEGRRVVDQDLPAEQIDIARASWWGFDPEDSTDALQAAINSGVKTLVVDNVGKPWVIRPITLVSDQEIVFESGVEVVAKRGEFKGKNDSLFSASNKRNISLIGYGAVLRMHRDDYAGPDYEKAEWRMALALRSCENVKVYGLTLADSGGDGIYLGVATRGVPCKDIHIKDVVCDRNYRQGISVISAENLLIENVVLSNTAGTAPQAGIDFEPNKADERLANIVLRNCLSRGNSGCGFMFHLVPLDAKSQPVSIRLENCKSVGNKHPFGLTTGKTAEKTVPGLVEFVGCEFRDDRSSAYIDKPLATCKLRLVDCVFDNVARDKPDQSPVVLGSETAAVEMVDLLIRDPLERNPVKHLGFAGGAPPDAVRGTVIVERDGKRERIEVTPERML